MISLLEFSVCGLFRRGQPIGHLCIQFKQFLSRFASQRNAIGVVFKAETHVNAFDRFVIMFA